MQDSELLTQQQDLDGLVVLVASAQSKRGDDADGPSDDYIYHRFPRWRDIAAALAAAVVENLGYRQLTA